MNWTVSYSYPPSTSYSFSRPLLLSYTFYVLFYLVFCFSGILTMVTNNQYRMGLVSLLVLPIFLLYGFKFDKVTLSYVGLVIIIGISGLVTQSPLTNIVLFLRIPLFSYCIYYLVRRYLSTHNIIQVLRQCLVIAILQLPIVIMQWFLYEHLPTGWVANAAIEDFGFGTFNYKTDYAMTFFVTLIVIFILFNEGSKTVLPSKYKWPVLLWLTLTVFIANSQLMKPIIILVWIVYTVRYIKISTVFIILILVSTTIITLQFIHEANLLTESPLLFIKRLSPGSSTSVNNFLDGRYDRFAALYYYWSSPINWLGDGPSRYSNAWTQQVLIGNFGHVFTFYSEIGLFGLLVSICSYFFMTFHETYKHKLFRLLSFFAILCLCFTSQTMNDIAVVFIYVIIAHTHLLPSQELWTYHYLVSTEDPTSQYMYVVPQYR